MTLKIIRTFEWVPRSYGNYVGAPINYELEHTDTLHYQDPNNPNNWIPVPIEEAPKPKHPNDIHQEKIADDLSKIADKIIADRALQRKKDDQQ